MEIEAVIFDVDGTLLDTETLATVAVQNVLSAFGKSDLFTWELNQQTLGLPRVAWVPLVLNKLDLTDLISEDDFFHAWEAKLSEAVDGIHAMAGAESLLDFFHSLQIPLAVATSSTSAAFAKKRVKHSQMFDKFEVIVCGDDPMIKDGKPSPDIYLLAAQRLGVHPSKCLVFEDAIAGVLSAKAAGMQCIAIPDSRIEKEPFLMNASAVIPSLLHFDRKTVYTYSAREIAKQLAG
jgi:HAD superfamily hydrolase (TIGR01509 family)